MISKPKSNLSHIRMRKPAGVLALMIISMCIACVASATINNSNDAMLLNDEWQYLEVALDSPKEANARDEWQAITLPHTWNATDTVDSKPGYRRNASWYKRSLELKGHKGKRAILYFEGANMETQVFVNGKLAGQHVGGYVGFEIDISDFVKPRRDNELMIRVSNRYNPNLVPSQKADFFIHGGITRDLWLKTPPVEYISRVFIDTPNVSAEKADTDVTIVGYRDTKSPPQMKMVASLFSPDGVEVRRVEQDHTASSKEFKATLSLPELSNPELWSTASPNLYTVTASLIAPNGKVSHTASERFGYRWFEMRPHQGFFVNDERVLIRGTHRHEEHAGIGAAMSNEQHRRDMTMIKEMGANFVRLGHYPQDPEVYRAADELGLILWDELPWCRGGKGGAEWEKNTESIWKSQVYQNRNHASIAFWSLGNEIYWEEDFPGGGATELLNPYLSKLNKMTKEWDSSRLTTIRKYYPGAELLDAFSPSIWAGWYGGAYGQYREALDAAHKKYPAFLHMEYGGSSHVGRHTEEPITKQGLREAQVSVAEAVNQAVVKSVAKDSDWNENYMVDLFDWHLQVSENMPNFAGNAQWAFKDFGTPLRPENPIPYMNQKGLVDRDGNPKDAYYVFASYWADKPFCYIESKTWTHRYGPKEGRDITAYCNTDSAELFLNGKSLGKKTKQSQTFPAGGLVWKTAFGEGKNSLTIKGYDDDKSVAEDSLDVTYHIGEHGKIKQIKMTSSPLENGRVLIEAIALDDKGMRVTDYAERAYFFNIGEHGTLVENQGTPNTSSIIEMANGRAAIEFIPGNKPGIVEFRSQNNKGVYITVPAKQ